MRKIELITIGKAGCILAVFCIATAISHAQTVTTLFTFDGTHGRDATGSLIQATDGNFYGVTTNGGPTNKNCPFGSEGCGVIYKVTSSGQETVVYEFCHKTNCPDGDAPNGALLQATNGNFYGATGFGGTSTYCSQVFSSGYGCGTIFELSPAGVLKVLYNFCSEANCADGGLPNGSLTLGPDGNLYGTTSVGGTNCVEDSGGTAGCGTIFKITPAGRLTTMYSFCAQPINTGACADGDQPLSGLTLATNGNFYGTTYGGGDGTNCFIECGTAFEITPGGKLTTLYDFCSLVHCTDGFWIYAGLVQTGNGDFYGTTSNSGGNSYTSPGTVFELTADGSLTTLYTFCKDKSGNNCLDGQNPFAGLVVGSDGNFYGTTDQGGVLGACPNTVPPFLGCGTLFKMTTAGELTKLYNFCQKSGCPDGAIPEEAMLQGTDGSFYGVTHSRGSGTCNCGTIFSLSVNLPPFVAANPNFGKASAVVDILGNSLSGATGVTFNGTAAKYKVVSGTYIEAQVPTGATSGAIEVTTPTGTLKSNVAFQVLP